MARKLPRVSVIRAAATAALLLVGAAEARSQPACTYTLSPGGAVIQNTGGSGLVSVATTASCFWQPQSLAPWISTMGSGVGNGSVAYYVQVNTTGNVRYGSINIAGQTFTIIQPGAPCTYALSPTSAALPTAGGSGLVTVTTPNGCPWQPATQVPWISTMGGGSDSGSFSFIVAANPTSVFRTGTVAVAGQTFTVTQAPLCTYSLSPTSASAASGGGSATFTVSAPAACSWQAVSQVSWIHVAGTGSGSGGASVTYSVDPNPAAASRSGSIVVGGQTFTVTQAAAPCLYGLSPAGAQVGSGGGGGSFSVTSPIGCAWQATSQVSWIHIAGTGSGSGGGSVSYSVDANPAGLSRTGSIAVANQTFLVAQAGVPCTYSLSPTHADLASGFGGGTFSVTAPAGCAWQATSQASWIGTTSSGNGSGSVIYSVPPNAAGTPRSGAITVAGQTFTVTQAGVPCTYSLSPSHADVGSGGGGGQTFSVFAPTGCAWQATSQAPWIAATGSGDGNGSVAYSVDANGASTSRSGAIAVAGQSFTVSQDGVPCTYVVSPAHMDVASSGATGWLGVTAPTGCTWQAGSPDGWINAPSAGSGSGTAAYTIGENPDIDERHGTITVADQVVPVTQAARINPPGPIVGPELRTAGNRFTVNGQQKFLLFVSYFDGMRVGHAGLEADLAYLKSFGVDGIRIFPNWSHYCVSRADDDALFTASTPSQIRLDRWEVFLDVLRTAAAHDMLVDVTFTRETVDNIDVHTYKDRIVDVARLLAGNYRHVLFDLANEHEGGDAFGSDPRLSTQDAHDIAEAVHADEARRGIGYRRLLTVSTGAGGDFEAGRDASDAGLDVVASHPDRGSNWYVGGIQDAVENANDGQGGPIRPVYLQEPKPFSSFFFPDGSGCFGSAPDTVINHHLQAFREAVAAGAAAYTFHTRTTFRLSDKNYLTQLESLVRERRTLEWLRADALMLPGDFVATGNDAFRLYYQPSGNLELVRMRDGVKAWESNTPIPNAGRAVMQFDGNFVLYDADGQFYWNTETYGHPGGRLVVNNLGPEDDQNGWVEVQDAEGVPLWRSYILFPHQALRPGRMLGSPNGNVRLTYEDGNLVMKRNNGTVLWESETAGTSPGEVDMQGEGNLVIYDADGNAVWASEGTTDPGSYLELDGGVPVRLRIRRPDGFTVWVRP